MKFRSFLSILAILVLVLLLTAGASAAWIVAQSPAVSILEAEVGVSATAIFVPVKAPIVASLLVNLDRLKAARLLSAPAAARGQIREDFRQLQQAFLPDSQLNYRRDIQPWLGNEMTIAITTPDFDRDRSNGSQLGYLVAMTAKDPALAERTLQSFWQRRGRGNWVSEQYAGAQIFYRQPTRQTTGGKQTEDILATLATAVVGDRFVLLANSPKVLRDALNNVQVAELSLASNEVYQKALKQVPADAIGLTFLNLPQTSAWLANDPQFSTAPHTYETLLAAWSLKPSGLTAEAQISAAHERPATSPLLSAPVGALRFVPAASALVIAGADLRQQLPRLEAGQGWEWANWAQQSIAKLEAQWHISLADDILSWAEGEYAVALLPQADRSQSDWVFVTQHSSKTAAGLEKLDAIAQGHNVILGSFQLDTASGSQEIFAWTKFSPIVRDDKNAASRSSVTLEAEVQGVRTRVSNAADEYDIFATSLEAMNLAIQPSESSLLNSKKFQAAIAPLESSNEGYIYLDRTTIRQWVQEIPGLSVDNRASKLLERLEALTVTGYEHTSDRARGAMSIQAQ